MDFDRFSGLIWAARCRLHSVKCVIQGDYANSTQFPVGAQETESAQSIVIRLVRYFGRTCI